MPKRIVIVGGLQDCPEEEQARLLARLKDHAGDDFAWEWLYAGPDNWNVVEAKKLMKLYNQCRNPRNVEDKPLVLKLYNLHGREASQLYKCGACPVEVPIDVECADKLHDFVTSEEAGIIPPLEWHGTVSDAALAAILSKLIRNKSWNKDVQGHAWTKESDLIGQSPVNRPDFQEVRQHALDLLQKCDGALLLKKGGNQGKTPLEWSINTTMLPDVKRAILSRNLAVLIDHELLAPIKSAMKIDCGASVRIDGEIVSEKVVAICRQ